MPTAPALQSLLAGTHCTKCGYPSCAAYAEALAEGARKPNAESRTPTNLCAPGGPRVEADLRRALNLSPESRKPKAESRFTPAVALIEEPLCIGCTKCLAVCPTGAIVGAPKQLHTILEDMCTGCGLCVPVCPATCITLNTPPENHLLTQTQPDGSTTPAAQAATKALVQAQKARKSNFSSTSPTSIPASNSPSPVTSHESRVTLSPELAALAAAARAKSRTKYEAMGPLKTPTALKKG